MQRGDIYQANLAPRSGSEQAGVRPVLIVSHDAFNRTENWRSIIVVPLSTSVKQAQRGPTAIFIPKDVTGLDRDSVVLCHQITTLDRRKLTDKLAKLPEKWLKMVEEGIKAAVGILK